MSHIVSLNLCFICLLFSSTAFCIDDWPQWRGPNRDGSWNEQGVIEKLPAQPVIKWRAKIGSGYTGPTVTNGRVYLMDRVTDPDQIERVLCFDAANGEEVWKHEYPCQYRIGYTAGPRASVTVDGAMAYALGAMGQLTCLDAKTGDVKWKKT